MRERKIGSYINSVARRSFAVDAQADADKAFRMMEFDPPSSLRKYIAAVIAANGFFLPATGELFRIDSIANWVEEGKGEPNALSEYACYLIDLGSLLSLHYINRNLPAVALIPEKVGVNAVTHIGADAIRYAGHRAKTLFKRRKEVSI